MANRWTIGFRPYWAAAQEHDLSGRAAHLHRDAAARAGDSFLGQSLAAALGRAPVVRHAQHGLGDWQRRRIAINLRVGTQAEHSWLPFWVKRLDEHAESIASALPCSGQAEQYVQVVGTSEHRNG
jgi:hypothetical protein